MLKISSDISKKFKKSLIIDIDNAYLRPINIHDISQLYIDGLNDSEVHQFLVAAKKKKLRINKL